MEDLIRLVYVEGDLLLTMVHLVILVLAFDCILAFGSAIKSIKGATL